MSKSSTSPPTSSAFSFLRRALAELVGPTRCAGCDGRVEHSRVLFCAGCLAFVERDARGIAPFSYGGALTTAIARFKYSDRADLAPRFGAAMLATARARGLENVVDIVIPIPLHPKRLADRGFNQAALLAAPIARAFNVPVAPQAVERLRHTKQQASLDRRERLVNLYGAFRVRKPELIRNARVLLVDDVRTTGVTLDTCAAALHEVGAKQVSQIVLARA